MTNEPINDPRLTPDLKLMRSGSVMQFSVPENRTHIPDIEIKAPRPELKAELVDGIWVWVNDCHECNGNPANWSYVKCDKHNVCVDCKTPRKELTEIPWGVAGGFRCKPCQKILDDERRATALAKVASEDYDPSDYQLTDEVTCPHCASTFLPDDPGRMAKEQECDICNGKFSVEVDYSVTFSTEIIGERVTE
jgi:hypothetical protein